jgi:uncharacterized protein (TIRG00374 family)
MAERNTIARALKVSLVVLALAALGWVLHVIGLRNIAAAMRATSRLSIAESAGLFASVFVLWAVRWQIIMRTQPPRELLKVFPILMAGVFGNLVTPGARVGGEPIRAYYMSKALGGEKSACFGTVLVDKFSNWVVFMGFLLASLAFVIIYVPLTLLSKVILTGLVVLVVVPVVSGLLLRERIGTRSRLMGRLLPRLYDFPLLRVLRRRFPTYQHFEDYAIGRLDSMWGPIAHTAGSPRTLTVICLLSAVSWLLYCMAHYVLFIGLGADIGFMHVLVIVTVAMFLSDMSVAPGGVGLTEAIMIGLCAAFGVDSSAAAAVTLISRGLFYLFGLGLGGLCLAVLALIYGRSRSPSDDHGLHHNDTTSRT